MPENHPGAIAREPELSPLARAQDRYDRATERLALANVRQEEAQVEFNSAQAHLEWVRAND